MEVSDAAIFRGIDRGAVDGMTSQLRPVGFPVGHVFFVDGDPARAMYIVVSGKVKISSDSGDGRRHLSMVVGPADVFGELSLLDPGPRTSTATALTGVSAAPMGRELLRVWLTHRPELTERLLRVMARRLRRTDERLCDQVFTDVAGRVAKELLALAQRFGVQEGDAMRLTHDLSQEELAQLVGATRETVNKALTEFTGRGWISLDGKSVLIKNAERLAARAQK